MGGEHAHSLFTGCKQTLLPAAKATRSPWIIGESYSMEQISKTLRSDGLLERWEPGDGQGRKAGVEGVAVENKSRKKTTVALLTFSGNNWGPYRRQDFSEGLLFHQCCRLCDRLILRPATAPALSVSQYIVRREQNGNVTSSWWLRCPIVFDLPPSPHTPIPAPTQENTQTKLKAQTVGLKQTNNKTQKREGRDLILLCSFIF